MSSPNTVLLCDRDVYALMAMKEQLTEFGFSVISCTTKKEALAFLERGGIDIVLSELNLEDSDAIVLCQEIRNKKEIHQPYILIHSEKNEDYVQITSFNSGADDFLIKPVKPIILAARFKALLKRQLKVKSEKKYPKKDLIIDLESYKVVKNGKPMSLPRKEFEMLNLLFSNPNKVFTRKEIAIELWKDEEVARQRTIDIHIRNIRKKVGQEVIRTLKGVGYCIA
jgi:two-component system alkaline phosphatase synthesis response regulator PhoP